MSEEAVQRQRSSSSKSNLQILQRVPAGGEWRGGLQTWLLEVMVPFGGAFSLEGGGQKPGCTAGRGSGGPDSPRFQEAMCQRHTAAW